MLLLLLFPAEFITIIPKPLAHADANWLDASWNYRKQHNLTGTTAGVQTNYPVEIDVSRDSGYTDLGKRVYVGTHAKSDYGDIRFTTSNGTTQLDYWLEETVTGRDRFKVFDKSEFDNPMAISQYGASGVVHPDVHYFADGMDGYKYWMVYTPGPSPTETKEKPTIARSNDGVTWTTTGISNPVVSLGASTVNPDPDMIYVSSLSKWFMVFYNLTSPSTRGEIGLAYSSNGKNWTNYDGVSINSNTNPIILSGEDDGGQSWEINGSASKLSYPTLLYDNGTFYLFYGSWKEGSNRGKAGYVTFNWENSTDDIENFTRYASNPVINLSADATFKSGSGHYDIVKNGTTYYMYAIREDTASTNYEMVLLTSTNMTTWTNQGRVIERGNLLTMFDYTHSYRGSLLSDENNQVVFLGGVSTMYYSGYDNNTNPHIGAAVGTGNFARFWVEVNSIAASPSTTTIYMYYGNSGASTTSSHTNTMINADDGASGNMETDLAGSATLTHTGGYYKSTEDSADDGFAAGKVSSNWNFMATIRVFQTFTSSGTTIYGMLDEDVMSQLVDTVALAGGKRRFYFTRYASNDGTDPNRFMIIYQDTGGTYHYWDVAGWTTTVTKYDSTGDLELRLWSDGTNLYLMVYYNNQQMAADPATIALSSVKSFSQGRAIAWTDPYTDALTLTQNIDRYFIRKYVSPEPTHGVWATEESMVGIADLFIHVLDFGENNLITATYIGYNGSSIQAVNSTGYVTFTNIANQSVIVLNRNIWQNSSTANGRVKVNDSNSISITMTGSDKTVAIKLSVYLVNLSFKDRNSTTVTPSNMSMTFGHNSTLKTFTTYSFLVGNYSNTPSRIYKWNSNVRHNSSDSFTASAYNANYTYGLKITGRTPYWKDFNGDTISNSHLASTYSIMFPNGTLKSSLTPGTSYKMQNGSSTVTNPLWQSMNVTHGTCVFDPYLYKPNFTLRSQNHNRAPADYFGLNSSMTKFKVGSSPSYVLQNGVNISYSYDGSSVVYFNHSPVLPIMNMTVQSQTQSNLTATIQDSSASYAYQLIWLGGVGNVTTTTTTTTTTHTTTSTTSIQNIVCPTYTPNITYTFFDGYESGNFSKWNSTASGTTGTINVTSHNPINGTYSEYVNIGGNANGFGYAVGTANLTSLGNSIWLQLYIRINPMVHSPNQEFHFLSLRNSSGAFLKIGIFHEGTEAHELEVELIDPVLGTVTLHSTDIGFDANSVQRIELGFFKNSTVGYVHAYVNGTQVINHDNIKSDYSAYNLTNFRVGAFENGAGIHHYNVTIDNVGLSTSRIGLPPYTCSFVAASYYGGNTPLGLIFVLLGMTMGAVLLIKRKRQI